MTFSLSEPFDIQEDRQLCDYIGSRFYRWSFHVSIRCRQTILSCDRPLGQCVDGDRRLEGQVVERTDYYSFGGCWEDRASVMMSAIHYNDKEEQSGEFGVQTLDYGASHYTPISDRCLSMDPLAEKYYSSSPYAFCGNNPIRFADDNGEDRFDKLVKK